MTNGQWVLGWLAGLLFYAFIGWLCVLCWRANPGLAFVCFLAGILVVAYLHTPTPYTKESLDSPDAETTRTSRRWPLPPLL